MDLLTLPVQNVFYNRKQIDTGVILGKRPFPRSRFYYSAKAEGRNISKPSPHKTGITMYIPLDRVAPGVRFLFRKKETGVETYDLRVIEIGDDFLSCEILSYEKERKEYKWKPMPEAANFAENPFSEYAKHRPEPTPITVEGIAYEIRDALRDKAFVWVETLHKFVTVTPLAWLGDHRFTCYQVTARGKEIKLNQWEVIVYDALTGKPEGSAFTGIYAPRYRKQEG